MNTKEAIEFCDEIDDMINTVEHLSDSSRSEIYRDFISLRKLLKRGKRYEKIFNELENCLLPEQYKIVEKLEQKYFYLGY